MRHIFRAGILRTRCRHYIERGNMAYGLRGADRLNQDGTFTEGTRIEVFSSIVCGRFRFHRGEHRPFKMKPCIPISCPPIEEHWISADWNRHE